MSGGLFDFDDDAEIKDKKKKKSGRHTKENLENAPLSKTHSKPKEPPFDLYDYNKDVEIQATLKNLIFEGKDGFKIFVAAKGKISFKVVTKFPTDCSIGDKVVLNGYTDDYKGQPRFNAKSITLAMPSTNVGVVRWLKKAKIEGVGEKTAEKIALCFRDDLLSVIGNAQELVKAGITEEMAEAIAWAWEMSSTQSELIAYLYKLGLKESSVVKIIRRYGAEAKTVIEQNPWILSETIEGVGFKTADDIALRTGHSRDSENRKKASLRAALLEAVQQNGHCGLPKDVLVAEAAQLAGLKKDTLLNILDELIDGESLIYEELSDLVVPGGISNKEHRLVGNIKKLLEADEKVPDSDTVREKIAEAEGLLGITLDEGQRRAAVSALTHSVSIITGGPGTGKSTTQKVIVHVLKSLKKSIGAAAPTGLAAKRLSDVAGIEASTCHRILDYRAELGGFNYNENNPLKEDWFIIDEFSMVDISLADDFVRAIKRGSGLTIVGDVDQLPSVGPGQVLRDLIYSDAIPTSRLSVIHRQANQSGIVPAAHRINSGLYPLEPGSHKVKGFKVENIPYTDLILSRIKKLVSNVLPSYGIDPMKEIQVLSPQRKGEVGIDALNDALKSVLNPFVEGDANSISLGNRNFTVGDRVIHVKNNYEKGVFNGEIGVVSKTGMTTVQDADEKSEPYIVVDYNGMPIVYKKNDVVELEPAFAVTVHKSQGCEFPIVIVVCHSGHRFMLQRNLLYTAVTRAKTLCILVGDDDAIMEAVGKVSSASRFTSLKEILKHDLNNEIKFNTPSLSFIQIDE